MPEPAKLAKAQLIQLKQDLSGELDGGKKVTVQFNPETLKLGYANQIVQPAGSGGGKGESNNQNNSAGSQSAGTAGRQFVGAGTTKLALQLWFDVTAPASIELSPDSAQAQTGAPVDDVRKLTQEVVFFMAPEKSQDDPNNLVPPGIRFHWGSFIFDGLVDSLEETLEFFSREGKPLRANIALNLSQQKILKQEFPASSQPGGGPSVGTQPLTAARAGATVQSLAASQGRADDWQRIAAANGIENPRRLQPGQLLNLNPPRTAGRTG